MPDPECGQLHEMSMHLPGIIPRVIWWPQNPDLLESSFTYMLKYPKSIRLDDYKITAMKSFISSCKDFAGATVQSTYQH